MKLIRHILSHLLLITVLFGLVAIYYYRYQVLPNNYAQKIDAYAEKIYPKLRKFVKTEPQNSNIRQAAIKPLKDKGLEKTEKQPVESEVIEVTPTEIVVEDKLVMPNETVMVDQVVKKEQPPEKKQAEQQAINNSETENILPNTNLDIPMAKEEKPQQPIIKQQDITEKLKPDVPSVVSDDVAQSADTENNLTTDKEAASVNDLLRSARSAFHKGKLDVSIEKYTELIELENDEADFYGELGNVYYAMGKWAKAGVAYYEAVTRLIEEKKFAQVAYLQRVIQGLDVERAKKLAEQLSSLNQAALRQ